MQTLGVICIQLVSINILSKYSSLISHRCSKVDTLTIDLRWSTHQSPIFEGRHIDHRSSKVNTSIFDGRHINHRSSKVDTSIISLRRLTHPSPKVDSSIFESRHIHLRRSTHRDIDLRRATHRSSKVDASIFEDQGGNITPTIRRRNCPQLRWSGRNYTRSYVHSWNATAANNALLQCFSCA